MSAATCFKTFKHIKRKTQSNIIIAPPLRFNAKESPVGGMRQKWTNWWAYRCFARSILGPWHVILIAQNMPRCWQGLRTGHAFALIVVKESLCCVCPPPVFSSQIHSWPGHPPSPCRSHSWSSVTPFAAKVSGGHPLVLPAHPFDESTPLAHDWLTPSTQGSQ